MKYIDIMACREFTDLPETINDVDICPLLHQFVVEMAEHALIRDGVDNPRAWAAVDGKRQWLAGEITDKELYRLRVKACGAAYAECRTNGWEHTSTVHSLWAATWAAAEPGINWHMVGEVFRHAADYDAATMQMFAERIEGMVATAVEQPQQLEMFA